MDGFSSAIDVGADVLSSAEKYNQYVGQTLVDNPENNPQQMIFSRDNVGKLTLPQL